MNPVLDGKPTAFFAPCPKGLEYLLVDELKALGADEVREALAGVHFSGALTLGHRVCLWSRLASRVLLPLAQFDADTAEQLYEGTAAIDWSRHMAADGTLAIDAHGQTHGVTHSQFAAQKVKDAIVDQFRERVGTRPNVERERPSLRVNLVLKNGKAMLAIDLAGGALFMRGYRRGKGEAPMKENLAAAMLLRAGWPAIAARGGSLLDPMCGSGTLLIEAALMAADIAPGLTRDYFGFFGWREFDREAWDREVSLAQERAAAGRAAVQAKLFGSDLNAAVLGAARTNAEAAGVAQMISLRHLDLLDCTAPAGAAPGLVIANPPYGERMGESSELVALYTQFGEVMRTRFGGWQVAFITSDENLARTTGLRAKKRYQLMNGALPCVLYCIDADALVQAPIATQKPLSPAAEGLRNRLEKNLRHLRARLKRENISCFRAYDADLPEYSAAIDVYGEWLHIQEYAAPDDIPERVAARRFDDLVQVAGEVFGLPAERIAIKTRRTQTRSDQYSRMDRRGQRIEVVEADLRFGVNLFDYLDTGLFLDHRPLRALIRDRARGKRFLNLFCYTASASVFAVAGGARSTLSVDLSANYLEWAAENFGRNGFGGESNRLVQGSVMEWLRHDSGEYDLIYADPPTFSNSKRADDFEVQRDHVELLRLCAARLSAGGSMLFSNHFRRFRLDSEALKALGLSARDITRQTIPFDFARDQRIHYCFELQATNA